MPQPRFITSDSQMGAPGVYVKENAPASPTKGRKNRVIGLVGSCLRGPGTLTTCTDYKRFLDVFGGRDRNTNGGDCVGHIWRALQGRRWGKIMVARAIADDAVKASFTLETATGGGGTQVLRVDASSEGAWGNDVGIRVFAATNGDANYFNLAVRLYGKVKIFENITIYSTNDNTNIVIGNDAATLIRLTKLANGRPVNSTASTDGADADAYILLGQTGVSGFTGVAGTDGTLAATDYTAAMQLINDARGIHACAVVGLSDSDIKDDVKTMAATASQRVWYVCPDDEEVEYGDAITERATFSDGRICYVFNHAYITDPVTKEEIVEEPFVNVLSIISQTDPDVHIGDFDNAIYTKAIRRVAFELSDTVRDALDEGGVTFIHKDQDSNGNEVIIPGNGLTCDFARNNKDLDGRYMKDFILEAIANRLRGDQFKGNHKLNRAARASSISSFLKTLALSDRYIARDDDTGAPLFQYTNDGTVNSPEDQAVGDQKEFLIARLIPKNIRIELLATIGVDATISEQ